MARPNLLPASTTSKVILSASAGSSEAEIADYPFGIYTEQTFYDGAADQVAYVYKKLGGDVLDIELTNGNVYSAYEEACLEYSYLVNIHQAKNSLGDLLGNTTASFDSDGQIKVGESLENQNIELKFPRYTFNYSQRVSDGLATETGVGGDLPVYSASFTPVTDVQDYDLQAILGASGISTRDSDSLSGNKKFTIRKVHYKSPRGMWRFFAYYGGLNVIGNLSSYGQYSDDSNFEIIPAWQNKLQAINYEDSLYTRVSHWSYEIHNNILRLYPTPSGLEDQQYWIHFTVERDAWEESTDRRHGADGVNNMNTLPFANIPYENINSIGKQWIRRFALAVCKEMLGQVRSKFGAVPIPGESVTLNGASLITEGKAEQKDLRDELKTILDELTYAKLAEKDAAISDNVVKLQKNIALPIYVG
jgi:hypothetical protein